MESNIAVFIDADNAPAAKIDAIYNLLAGYGNVTIRRAYGDWTKPNLKPWLDILNTKAITPIMQQALTSNKNASDIALVIDAMDIVHQGNVNAICIVSSDCDFAPLAKRVRESGINVYGFGERKAPESFVEACSRFLFLDVKEKCALEEDSAKAPQSKAVKTSPLQKLKSDSGLMNLLRNAIEAHEDNDGWAKLGIVGSHINNQTSFDHRNYGFSKLVDLFEFIDLFDVRRVGARNLQVEVKDNRRRR